MHIVVGQMAGSFVIVNMYLRSAAVFDCPRILLAIEGC